MISQKLDGILLEIMHAAMHEKFAEKIVHCFHLNVWCIVETSSYSPSVFRSIPVLHRGNKSYSHSPQRTSGFPSRAKLSTARDVHHQHRTFQLKGNVSNTFFFRTHGSCNKRIVNLGGDSSIYLLSSECMFLFCCRPRFCSLRYHSTYLKVIHRPILSGSKLNLLVTQGASSYGGAHVQYDTSNSETCGEICCEHKSRNLRIETILVVRQDFHTPSLTHSEF